MISIIESQLFGSKLFIQVGLFLVLLLLTINTSLYATALLGLLAVVLMTLSLFNGELSIFAIFLLIAEVHVFYIIACLSLTWSRFDTLLATSAASSKMLNNSKMLGLLALVALIAAGTLGIERSTAFYTDSYVYILLLDSCAEFAGDSRIMLTSVTSLLSMLYLTTLSFEFFILNILMFLVVIVFFQIQQSSRKAVVLSAAATTSKMMSLMNTSAYIIRQQNQAGQLSREPAARCINATSVRAAALTTTKLTN